MAVCRLNVLDTVTEDYSLNARRHFGAVGSVGEGFWVTKRKFCGRLAGERRERKSRFRLHLCFDACAFLNILALSFAPFEQKPAACSAQCFSVMRKTDGSFPQRLP